MSRATDLLSPFLQFLYCDACISKLNILYQRCVNGGATTLDLDGVRPPVETFFPIMLEGDLMLSHRASAASSDVPSTTDTAGSLSETGSSSTTSTTSSTSSTSTTSTSSTSTSDGSDGEDDEESGVVLRHGGQSGVIWNVSALPQLSQSGTSMMDWTIFPSSGLLLPGERCVPCDTTSSHYIIRELPIRAARPCNGVLDLRGPREKAKLDAIFFQTARTPV